MSKAEMGRSTLLLRSLKKQVGCFLPGDLVTTYIRMLNGDASGKAVLLDKPVVTCGRHHENDLALADDDASRHHCRFVLVNGSTYLIEDAGSSNGTYVNDTLVRYKILAVGDRIRIGKTLLEITTMEERSFDKSDSSHKVDEFSFEADLVPGTETARPVLNSSIESYPEVVGEQGCFELKAELDFVYRVSAITSKNLTLESLCHNLATLVGDWAGVRQAMLVLLHENEHDFSRSFTSQRPTEDSLSSRSAQQPKLKFNRGLVDRVLASQLPAMSTFEVATERSQKVTAMCVPVCNGRKLLGLIYVDDFQGLDDQAENMFSNTGLEVLAAIGKQVAAAIENNIYFRCALGDAAKKAVEKLTSVVSHRINNLMHLVSGGEFLIETGLKSKDLEKVAQGWGTVRRTQSRISQLSTNMAWYGRELKPLIRKTQPHKVINVIVTEMTADYGETRLKVVDGVAPELSLNLDSHYFERAVRNILAVGFWAAENGSAGQDTVALEIELLDDWYVVRVSFRHFDDRFDLAELGKGEIDCVNAEFGFLEMLIAQRILVSEAGSLACSTDSENLNTIEVRLPLVQQT